MKDVIITCNAGSSSLKCALFEADGETARYQLEVDRVHEKPVARVTTPSGATESEDQSLDPGFEDALSFFLRWCDNKLPNSRLVGAGHRIVHGGSDFSKQVKVTGAVRKRLYELAPLAPLHQPHNLELIDRLAKKVPDLPQVACFDTAFHHTRPRESKLAALPRELVEEEGLYRFGFHGLSYEYISESLAGNLESPLPPEKVISVHLGSGASACALKDGKSIATTMGFSALDGLMMGTRCGRLDPGVLLYLLQEKNMSAANLQDLLYNQSGLLGVSGGLSGDMREIEASDRPEAREAFSLFGHMAAREIGGLIPVLGGLDLLVFTGAMGANSSRVRETVCSYFKWLPLKLDLERNGRNEVRISSSSSSVKVLAMETNEEVVIARQTAAVLNQPVASAQ